MPNLSLRLESRQGRSLHRLADALGIVLGYTGSPCLEPGTYTSFPDLDQTMWVSRGEKFPLDPTSNEKTYWALIHSLPRQPEEQFG